MHTYRKRTIVILSSFLLTFFLIFIFAYVQLRREIAIFNIGLPYYIEDMMVIILSFFSMMKIVYEINEVEHPEEYEGRVKG
jgi:hypothetical protein